MKNKNLENFNFSYSSVNAFETCKYQFKLVYIDKVKRENNFFSDYGSWIHGVVEEYFKGKLEIYELYDYYKDNFDEQVKELPPSYMKNIRNSYYESGCEFFKNFDFDKTKYEMINVEEFVKGKYEEIGIVIKPDLIFKSKLSEDIIILDFKTSEIEKNGKIDKNKLEGYKNQINLYIQMIYSLKGIEIKKARLWFIRSNTFYEWEFDPYQAQDVMEWFVKTANEALEATEFPPNNKNKFFCNVLCSARSSCKYRPK